MAAETNSGRSGRAWLTAAWITVTGLILLAPLVAMRMGAEGVNWTAFDFAMVGGVLVTAGLIYEFAARSGNLAYQAAVVVALGASVLTLWVTGAVGIIGNEGNPGNLLYLAVVALAIAGAVIARGRARPMAWVMLIVAIAEAAVPVIAFAGVANPTGDVLAPEVLIATVFFTLCWLLSAWLFRHAQ